MLKTFRPAEFAALFAAAALPNLRELAMTPVITGDGPADDRIRALAHSQGYTVQPLATGDLVCIDASRLDGYLQPLAAQGWRQLTAAAGRGGMTLAFVSGYRSCETQRILFLERLRAAATRHVNRAYTSEEIAAGVTDAQVRGVLSGTAPPGYSRHHTGYALDLNNANSGLPYTQFRHTAAYRWLSADNFAQTKACGFIPSYPEGGPHAGPRAEPWEFVWVGSQPLRAVPEG